MIDALIEALKNVAHMVFALINGTDRSPYDVLLVASLLLLLYIVMRTLYILSHLIFYGLVNKINGLTTQKLISTAAIRGKKILIIGDSTAFGTGARRPEDSIGGRLARDFKDTNIINYGVNGALTKGVAEQIERAKGTKFDMVIVSTGGNDIWHFTSVQKIEYWLEVLLKDAIEVSDHRVIVLLYANFGLSPLFPRILRQILVRRSDKVRLAFEKVCGRYKVPCIDLFLSNKDDILDSNPFKREPELYFSSDYMHPSSEGYGLWYKRMWAEMVKKGYYFKEEFPTEMTRAYFG
jgi:lysophospholipase L1-like esterase